MKTIVITGGTAGIGLAAAQQMQENPDIRLLVGARDQTSAGLEILPLDLAKLDSVRGFAAAVEARLGDSSIDGLVLNAGIFVSDIRQRTGDGLETTFAVNHLAHYLLLRLLMPRLASGATVVITTSSLHDPKTNPSSPPEHADAEMLARGEVELRKPQTSRLGMRAYATSKLCNVLTARALASSATAQNLGLRVIAFNPGLTPGTRLARHQTLAVRFAFAFVTQILSAFLRMNTVASGGEYLAGLALGGILPARGRIYASQVKRQLTWPDILELASDDAVMVKLWRDSAALVGLPEASQKLDRSI